MVAGGGWSAKTVAGAFDAASADGITPAAACSIGAAEAMMQLRTEVGWASTETAKEKAHRFVARKINSAKHY